MKTILTRMSLLLAVAVSSLGVLTAGAQANTSAAKPKVIIVKSGQTTLTASTATVKFLTSHGITVTPLAPATMSGASVTLPVVGGIATDNKLRGVLVHRGGVRFASATKKVNVRHVVIYRKGGPTWLVATVNGKVARLAKLTSITLKRTGKNVTLTGEVRLTAQAAHLINKLFGKHLVSAGFDLGSLTSQLKLA